ncbi:hypothetical protein Bca4012_097949 [Brassica carinata]
MFNFTSYYFQDKSTGPVTKEELGKATWTFLHTLAAQVCILNQMLFLFLLSSLSRKANKAAKEGYIKELMAILSRMYPCRQCADHFKEILSLGKLVFPCERVDARWGKLECEQKSCDLHGTSMDF